MNPLSSAVEIITNIEDDPEIIDGDLNYDVFHSPLDLGQLLNSLDMDNYSPVTEQCLDDGNYPAGYLYGCDADAVQASGEDNPNAKVKVAIIDTGLADDESYSFIWQYVEETVNVLNMRPQNTLSGDIIYTPNQGADDQNGHGTSVTGIIAGLSQRAAFGPDDLGLYIIQAFDPGGQSTIFEVTKAIEVAKSYGVHIINISWAYKPLTIDEGEQTMRRLLSNYRTSGEGSFITIAGAGNDNTNLEYGKVFPAAFKDMDKMLTIGGVDCSGDRSSFSNYGGSVSVYAPAEHIISPLNRGMWALNNEGTSFAAPIVTAATIQAWRSYFPYGVPEVTGINTGGGNIGSNQTIGNNLGNVASYEDLVAICNVIKGSTTEEYQVDIAQKIEIINFAAACSNAKDVSPYDTNTNGGGKKLGIIKNTVTNTKNAITVYPNPSKGQFYISFDRIPNQKHPVRIEIISTLGEVVISDTYHNSNNIEISLNEYLPTGMYFLNVIHNNEITYTQKIILE